MKLFRTITVMLAQMFLLVGMAMPTTTFAQDAAAPVGRPDYVAPSPQNTPTPTKTPNTTAPAASPAKDAKPDSTTPDATPDSAAGTVPTDTFVPLNPIPGIIAAGNAPSLPVFLNGLYKICIGVAATIAVLQLMRAGFMFMVNKGSVSHNEAAKSIITNSILGLVLVLSPAIVFGIINPKILNLDLDVSSLQPTLKKVDLGSTSTTTVTAGVCTAFGPPKIVTGTATNACSTAGSGYVATANSCCTGMTAGNTCCAQQKVTNDSGLAVNETTKQVDAAMNACGIKPTDQQKSCLYEGAAKVLAAYNSCMSGAGFNGIAACVSQAVSASRTAVHSCIPSTTTANLDCVQSKLIPSQ